MRASLNCALISSTSILQTKRHGDIAISPEWGYECSLYLIFNSKFNLVIASCGIQKRQQLTPGRRINHLIDTGVGQTDLLGTPGSGKCNRYTYAKCLSSSSRVLDSPATRGKTLP